MHNLVFEKSGILLFASLDCIILHINGKQFRCSVFTFVRYITNTGITDFNDIELFSQPLHIITEALEGHFYLLLITYYLLLITYHLLLITYYLSLFTYYLLLII